MKKLITMIAVILFFIIILFNIFFEVKEDNYTTDISNTSKFTTEDIESAFSEVVTNSGEQDIDFIHMTYDENKSNKLINKLQSDKNGESSISDINSNNIIIVFSDFKIPESAKDTPFEPGKEYNDWAWILEQDGSNWKIIDSGYSKLF